MHALRRPLILISLAVLAPFTAARAATVTWTGNALNGSWHTPGNWDIGLPMTGDDVIIPDVANTTTVTYSTGTTSINSLTCDEAFILSGGTLNIAAASSMNASFTLTGGTLGGTGDVTANGSMSWTGGTMSGTGRTIIATSGSLSMSSTNQKTLSRVLENHATASWTDGDFAFIGGTLENSSDSTFTATLAMNRSFLGAGGINAVNNAGTMSKAGAGTLTSNGSVPFNNTGTVNLDAGGLTLSGGGSNSGQIDADAGTTLTFTTSYTHGGASSLTGQGTLTFSGGTHTITGTLETNRVINIGAIVNVNAPYTFLGTLNLMNSGTLGGSGDATIMGALNWTGTSTMSGSGKTIIPSGVSLTLSDSGQKNLNRVLENHSTITWSDGTIALGNGTLDNTADGTFDAILPTNRAFLNAGGINAVNNVGVFNKTGSATLTVSVPFNNTGTVNLDAGGLTFGLGGTNSTQIDADAGTTLAFTNSYTHGAASSLTGTGTLTFSGGTHTIAGTLDTNRIINISSTVNFNAPYTFLGTVNLLSAGTLAGSGIATISGDLNWTGTGTMSGTGTTIIAAGGSACISDPNQKTLFRTLENHSTIEWNGGNIAFGGGMLNNAADGSVMANLSTSVDFVNAGGTNAVVNAGTFTKGGLATLTCGVGIPVSNTGTIDLQSGTVTLAGGLSNFSGTTLTGGSFVVAGTLRFPGANIVTNAATIILDGPSAAILNSSNGTNALANFATNAATGSFQIRNGRNFTLPGTLTNMGLVTIGPVIVPGDTTLSVATYNQLGGTTVLDGGHLSASTMISSDTAITGGGGVITPLFVNTGTVTAEGPNGPPLGGGDSLDLSGVTAIVNDGLFQAITGGTMELSENVSGAGTYRADAGTLRLLPAAGATPIGGMTLNVLNDGRVDVNGDADVTLTAAATFASGGSYGAEPQAIIDVTNTLAADSLTVHCTAAVELEGAMALVTDGDLTLDGESAPECSLEGGTTPPVFGIIASATVQVAGNFQVAGCAQVNYGSAELMALAGHFNNQSTCGTDFQWSGGVLMNGQTESAQNFEVAGHDFGPTPAGFFQNFAMGSVHVANGASVTMRDAFDNDGAGQSACSEALYVSQLVLQPGATLVLDNCRVYVGQLTDQGATINLVGCGEILPTGDANGDGVIDLIDYCSFGACLLGAMPCTPGVSCTAFDYDADGDTDLADFAMFQTLFGAS